MRLKGLFAIGGLILACAGWNQGVLAQEGEEPEKSEAKRPRNFGLYLKAMTGSVDTGEFNTSIETLTTKLTENRLKLTDSAYAQVAVGWKLANEKGDVRFTFEGFSEDGYSYRSIGQAIAVPGAGPAPIREPADWWTTTIENGVMTTVLDRPFWDASQDTNNDGIVDPDEVQYGTPDFTLTKSVTDNLQNRQQLFDILYGREFGGRRFSGRWFAGIRHFEYDGNLIASAWVSVAAPPVGYTDGFNNRPVLFSQQTKGNGPTGSMESQFNFFERRLQLYVKGQAAFMVQDLEADSGTFVTIVASEQNPSVLLPIPARLMETRSKSTWQTGGEVGLRVRLKNGLEFEAAYNITGLLDSILLPPAIQVPENIQEANVQPPSAVYSTQDIVHDGWRAGFGFQF